MYRDGWQRGGQRYTGAGRLAEGRDGRGQMREVWRAGIKKAGVLLRQPDKKKLIRSN